MDWFPLYNTIRIALIATVFTFFIGIFTAYYVAKLPRLLKGVLDCILTLPLVLPPTVIGFFLLKTIGVNGPVGKFLLAFNGTKLTMTWYASILAVIIVTFPPMYRTTRSSFEAFDKNLIYAGKTLGLSNTFIFWRIFIPGCKDGLLAGVVLAFARGLGEYGATSMVSGYTPGRTATISTTVYQMWREGNDELAYKWVFINLAISFVVLVALNLFEKRAETRRR
ncbi:MAG: molybdate ABC transporter permease subunit [Clostridiales bacterium]|nr:molybdate ABC transporter permease subunit [Clostridiales bacterium]